MKSLHVALSEYYVIHCHDKISSKQNNADQPAAIQIPSPSGQTQFNYL
jgi:hypothetical protein